MYIVRVFQLLWHGTFKYCSSSTNYYLHKTVVPLNKKRENTLKRKVVAEIMKYQTSFKILKK